MTNMQLVTKQFRKSVIVITGLILTGLFLAGGIPLLHRGSQQAPMSVTAMPISSFNKAVRIERAGSVVHANVVPVYSEGTGHVSDVYVTSGQVVKAGQPLVKLEMTGGDMSADTTGTMETPNSVSVETPPATNEEYDKALKEYDKYQKLYEKGAIARKQLEAAEARLQAAQTSQVDIPQQSPVAPARVPTNTVPSGPVTIQASMDGTITGNVVTVGSAIQIGQQLMALGSGQDVEIVVPLTQSELYLIQLGSQTVIEALGQTIVGQVSSIYPEIKEQQITSFIAHIKPLQPPGNLLTIGMALDVRMATGQEVVAIGVPVQAVCRDEEGAYFIFLAIDGKAVWQQVTIGEVRGDLCEITSAIPQGSRVIIGPIEQLKNGDAIAISE